MHRAATHRSSSTVKVANEKADSSMKRVSVLSIGPHIISLFPHRDTAETASAMWPNISGSMREKLLAAIVLLNGKNNNNGMIL